MNPDQIRRRLIGGFQPFILRTSDGREFRVPQPELVAVGKHEVAVVDGNGHIDTLDPLHIASITTLELATTRAGNGRSRRNAPEEAPGIRKEATFTGPDLRFVKIGDDSGAMNGSRKHPGPYPDAHPAGPRGILGLALGFFRLLAASAPAAWFRRSRAS